MLKLSRSDWVTLLLMIFGVVGISMVFGLFSIPGEWYASLNKPPFNPPNWIFAPVWIVLYLLIGFAGWATAVSDPFSRAFKVWLAQLVLNWSWSLTFFTAQQIWLALIVIIVMVFLVTYFILLSWRANRAAALAMVPYLAWISFATILNIAIATLNS